MEINLKAGQRVLYKRNGVWRPGTLPPGHMNLTTEGLFTTIYDIADQTFEKNINVNSLYLNGFPLEDWAKEPPYCMKKQEFIEIMHSDEFIEEPHTAFVSDGDYAYYPVNKFTENWINKQPFEYIVIGE